MTDATKRKVEVYDAHEIGEAKAKEMFGPDLAGFMKAVAKAGKRYNIGGCVMWVMHRNVMRCASFGHNERARGMARELAQWLSHQAALLLGRGGSA